jgi:lysine/ornithine N-monooxygenase
VEFSTLKDPKGIAEYILNELFETLFDNGIKNIKHFVQMRATSIVQSLDPESLLKPSQVR